MQAGSASLYSATPWDAASGLKPSRARYQATELPATIRRNDPGGALWMARSALVAATSALVAPCGGGRYPAVAMSRATTTSAAAAG